jgi:uncharacterized glyoxalase superfamily protein PhnB
MRYQLTTILLLLFLMTNSYGQEKEEYINISCNGGFLQVQKDHIILPIRGAEEIDMEGITEMLSAMEKEPENNGKIVLQLMDDGGNGFVPVFIFSELKANLSIEIYDEEGFGMGSHEQLLVETGFNLYALNVRSFEEGPYFFRLKGEGIFLTEAFQVGLNSVYVENVTSSKAVETVDFMGSKMSITETDILKITKPKDAVQNDDAVTRIMRALLEIENSTLMLDVAFSMSDEPVSKMFVFGIETEQDKTLSLNMYDEEGFEIASDLKFSISAGNNYRALDVSELENGVYFFILKDQDGKELVRQLRIKRDN